VVAVRQAQLGDYDNQEIGAASVAAIDANEGFDVYVDPEGSWRVYVVREPNAVSCRNSENEGVDPYGLHVMWWY
jgi:hypothetical protein